MCIYSQENTKAKGCGSVKNKNKIFPERLLYFLLLVIATIVITYRAPRVLASIWYAFLLVLYYMSKDEAFWLAFFLVTVDGFMGFMGLFSVTLNVLPDLPAIELCQFYIILSFVKAAMSRYRPFIFYKNYLQLLLVYIIFLIVWGQMMGYTGELNAYFRIIKQILPFLLFYSLPRLFTDLKTYERFFGFIFFILIIGFLTQLFTILTGISPSGTVDFTEQQLSEAMGFRPFFNGAATLLGLLGALFLLSGRAGQRYHKVYLYICISSAVGMVFLSATRGWIISFGLILILAFIVALPRNTKQIIGLTVTLALFFLLGLSNSKIRSQAVYSFERLSTLESITEGDITAEGTLYRLNLRGPKVMNKWKENPIFGWGFSDETRKYGDGHVGNQNLLMTTGIVGFFLIVGFLIYFSVKLFLRYLKIPRSYIYRNNIPVFLIFLAGWFIIHSTSGQQFNVMALPLQVIPQVVFFSLGALQYNTSIKNLPTSHVQKNPAPLPAEILNL
jgi:hypothetical protein